MKKIIIASMLLSLSIFSGVSALTSLEKVTEIQRTTVGVPIAPSGEPKGYVGSLIADIFWASGKIKTIFISAFQDIDTIGFDDTIPRWIKATSGSEGKFAPGTIRDDGTNIAIGTGIVNNTRVNIAGNINISGQYYQDGLIFTPNIPADVVRTFGNQDIAGVKTFGNVISFESQTPVINFTDTDTSARGYITANSVFGSIGIVADQDAQVPGSRIGFSVDNTAGNPQMVIHENGNIGIGVTNPAAKLEVDGNVQVGNKVTTSYSDNTRYGYFEVKRQDGLRGAYFGYGNGTGRIDLQLDTANTLIISGGDVGIGTSNPAAKLHVSGNIIASTPTENNHVATKKYVDDSTASTFVTTTRKVTGKFLPTGGNTIEASCNVGETLITGGCKILAFYNEENEDGDVSSYPVGNKWMCQSVKVLGADIEVSAVCAGAVPSITPAPLSFDDIETYSTLANPQNIVYGGSPVCSCQNGEMLTGCSGPQRSDADTSAILTINNACYGERSQPVCTCMRKK